MSKLLWRATLFAAFAISYSVFAQSSDAIRTRIAAGDLPEPLKIAVQELALPTSADTRFRIEAAALSLQGFPSAEVARLLMDRLTLEIDSSKPNSQVLRKILRALEGMGSRSMLEEFFLWQEEALEKLLDHLDALKLEATRRSFHSTAVAMQMRHTEPTSLFESGTNEPVTLIDTNLDPQPRSDAQLPTFEELAQKADFDVGPFLTVVSENFYDKAIQEFNRTGDFVRFVGREQEVAQICEALRRMDKSHILLTGKAGVGKTTILKLLMQRFVLGDCEFVGNGIPLAFKLPITAIADRNFKDILQIVEMAQAMAHKLDRHVILFVDEAHVASDQVKNALKDFLTEVTSQDDNKVHFVWATTSGESREFDGDKAFRRRWLEVFIPEFDRELTLRAIKETFVPRWQKLHRSENVQFQGISNEAYVYAFKNGHLEQPNAGNPTASKELLEGAIIHKLSEMEKNDEAGTFELEVRDVQNYLRSRMPKRLLVPGDPEIETRFEEVWAEFEARYRGADGFKAQLKQRLRRFFQSSDRSMMDAYLFLGPPGAGKTYAAELIAELFFGGAILRMNGADYKEAHAKSRATGAPPGYVGFKERVSEFSQFFADNPYGGVIKIEEADYLNQAIIQMLTNMITDTEFRDARGNSVSTAQYLIVANTNIGQQYLVSSSSKLRMTWEQYENRRRALTETAQIDGVEYEVPREDKLNQAFDEFVRKIVTQSHPNDDTAIVAQETVKQRRRYQPFYVLSPDRAELEEAAKARLKSWLEQSIHEFAVHFEIEDGVLEKVVDLDRYDFDKGFSYANNQLEDNLFYFLADYRNQRGANVKVGLEEAEVLINGVPSMGMSLVVRVDQDEKRFNLTQRLHRGENQWSQGSIRERIARFEELMGTHIKGKGEDLLRVKRVLQSKLIDWDTQMVFTRLGTSGNGKTEFAKALARVLFEDEKAIFAISGIQSVSQLTDYLRPPAGYQGGKEQTEFELWLDSRINAGGGVILLDEFLSFHGLKSHEIAEKIQVINRLYDLLDEQSLNIGGKKFDLRAFVIVITGNALQEFFDHIEDLPNSEDLVDKVISSLTERDILAYFNHLGIDAPKIARFGEINVEGPLPAAVSREVGRRMLEMSVQGKIQKALTEMRRGHFVPKIEVADEIVDALSLKVKTVRLGMRKVAKGLKRLITQPMSGILLRFPDLKSLRATFDSGVIHWFVDDVPVVLGFILGPDGVAREEWIAARDMTADHIDHSPQLKDIEEPEKVVLSRLQVVKTAVHEVLGHWMASVLVHGKNRHQYISIIPDHDSLGSVLMKKDKEVTQPSLTSLLKSVIYLEAGHRSLFVKGVYATGGGSISSDVENRNDDMIKVEREYQKIINNQLVEGHGEFSRDHVRQTFKDELRLTMKEVTDRVIAYGLKLELFEGVYERAVEERFLREEELDAEVEKMLASGRLLDGDRVFLFFLEQVISERMGEASEVNKKILSEILKKSLNETLALRGLAGDLPSELNEWIEGKMAQHNFSKHTIEVNCDELLR